MLSQCVSTVPHMHTLTHARRALLSLPSLARTQLGIAEANQTANGACILHEEAREIKNLLKTNERDGRVFKHHRSIHYTRTLYYDSAPSDNSCSGSPQVS